MSTARETFNEKPVYTLTDISKSLRSVVAKNYPRPYYIKAEIVKLNYYPHSGHCYPELAEKEGTQIKTQMRAIIWNSQFRDINDRFLKITGEPLKEGINILCLATIEYDVKYGLSLHIQNIEPTYTMGEMVKNKMLVIEQLKKEKTFNANKEKILPLLPKRIAVISVETSKGYGDFMVTLKNNPYHYHFECRLFTSILQGDKAITTITARLREIAEMQDQFDCAVIIRGGGGDVGLSCYDDYLLANSVATFPLPVIVGIGHSTNVTVTDMVAYQSKITPTDVANFFIDYFRSFDSKIEEYKMAINRYSENLLKEESLKIMQLNQFRDAIAAKIISGEQAKLEQLFHRIKIGFTRVISPQREQVANMEKLSRYLAGQILAKQNEEIQNMEDKISLMHPDNILKRGYSITYFNGKAITDRNELSPDDEITTKLFSGEITSIVK